jgi:hypothetical protein
LLFRLLWPLLVAQALWGAVALRHGRFWAFLRGKLDGLVAFRAARSRGHVPHIKPDRLLHVLQVSEDEIGRLQRQTGFDWYWRVYFMLTSGGAD